MVERCVTSHAHTTCILENACSVRHTLGHRFPDGVVHVDCALCVVCGRGDYSALVFSYFVQWSTSCYDMPRTGDPCISVVATKAAEWPQCGCEIVSVGQAIEEVCGCHASDKKVAKGGIRSNVVLSIGI